MPDNLNWIGSSGWGILPDGRYGRLTTTPRRPTGNQRQDYGVYDAGSNRVISILTREPWTGVEPRTGNTYAAGVPVPQSRDTVNAPGIGPVNPNDPNQVFRPFTLPREPAMESTRQELMRDFSRSSDTALTGVTDYLNNFQNQLRASETATAAATDPSQAISDLQNARTGYSDELDAANAAYRQAMDAQASGMRGVVTQAQNDLAGFNAAKDAVKADQLAQYMSAWKQMKMAGTNALSGYDTALLASEAARAAIPLELAKQERQYDILRSMAMPVEQTIGSNALAYASAFLPAIGASRFSANTSIPLQIQNLLQATAGMKREAAIQFMQAQAVPVELINRILALQASTGGALTQWGDLTQTRGVHNVLGTYLQAPTPVSANTGPLPTPPSQNPYPQPAPQMYPQYFTPSPTASGTPPAVVSGGVPYRPITGAPGGRPFDYGSYFAQFQPNWQGPLPYPVSQAHSTPNLPSGGQAWTAQVPEQNAYY